MPDWMAPFGRTIDAAKKYVVSSTLDRVDWNAELVRGDLGKAVLELKWESGKGLFVGGVKLPLALAELGLIDEYEFVAAHAGGPRADVRSGSRRARHSSQNVRAKQGVRQPSEPQPASQTVMMIFPRACPSP
jgi:dihydrofolate reductase